MPRAMKSTSSIGSPLLWKFSISLSKNIDKFVTLRFRRYHGLSWLQERWWLRPSISAAALGSGPTPSSALWTTKLLPKDQSSNQRWKIWRSVACCHQNYQNFQVWQIPTAVPLVKLDNLASLEGAQIEYRPRGCQLQSVQRLFLRFGSETCCESCQKRSREKKFCDCGTVLEPKCTKMFYRKYMKMQFEGFKICSSMFTSTGFVVTVSQTMESLRNIPVFQKAEHIATLKQGNCSNEVLHQASLWMTYGLRKNDNHMDILYLPFFCRFTVLLGTLVSSFAMFHRFTTSPVLSRMLWKRLPKPNWQPKPRSWDGWHTLILSSISLKTQTSTTSNLRRPQWSDVSSKLGHLLCGI